MDNYKVYRLAFTKDCGEVTYSTFYFGITKHKLQKRFKGHVSTSHYCSCTNRVISEFHNNVKECFIILVKDNLSKYEAEDIERELINKYALSHGLINVRENKIMGAGGNYNLQTKIMFGKISSI